MSNMFADLRHAGDFLTRNARRLRAEFALAYEGRRFTWDELNRRANRFGNSLQALGIQQGQTICIYARNSNQFVEALFGAAKVGVAVATVNYRLIDREIEFIVRDSGSAAMVFDHEYAPVARSVRANCPSLRRMISIGGDDDEFLQFEHLLAESRDSEPVPEHPIQDEDPFILIYTSGTTGRPKGAVWWHKGTILNMMTFMYALGLRYGMRLVLPAPLYATAGASMILGAFCAGASSAIINFEPRKTLEVIAAERADFINLVPATINFVLNVPEFRDYDLSSLKTIVYAGAVMPVPLLRRAIGEFGCGFRQLFGMTETCAAGTVLEPWEHVLEGESRWVRRLASCGRAEFNVQVRVVDDRDEDVAAGGPVGEMIVKSDGNILRYHNLPDKTAETVRDGWVYTGDCGWIDEDGFIYIVDRKIDMIVSGALNIYPAEIESVLFDCPGVLDCAVIGVPDPTWGETVKAIIVSKEGASISADDIIAFCRTRLAPFKKPRSVEFVESLPRNVSGKVLKRVLRERYWQGESRKV